MNHLKFLLLSRVDPVFLIALHRRFWPGLIYDLQCRRFNWFKVNQFKLSAFSRGFRGISHVKLPTFLVQVRNDASSSADDIQWMYDHLPVEDKKIYFIEDTPWRFHGYTYFSDHPEQMIEWFDTHMN